MTEPGLPTPKSSWSIVSDHRQGGGSCRVFDNGLGARPSFPAALKLRIMAALEQKPRRAKELIGLLGARPATVSNALTFLARKRRVNKPTTQGGEWSKA